jgi:plastocyanin
MTTTPGSWRGLRWIGVGVALALMTFALAGLHSELASAGPSAAISRAKNVGIAHFAFHPPTLTVAAGTKVVFTNSSKVTHTATRAGSFSTGHIKPGESVGIRFNQTGSFAYHCSIHPFMHGKIVVQ